MSAGALLATVTLAPSCAWAEASPATKADGPPQEASMLMVMWRTRTGLGPGLGLVPLDVVLDALLDADGGPET